MSGGRLPPQTAQQPGDDGVLLGFGKSLQGGARPAPLQEQGDGHGVDLGHGVQHYGAIAVPDPQTVGLMLGLRVAPEHLHHQILTVAGHWGHPCRLPPGLERFSDADRPIRLQIPDRGGQPREPALSLFTLGRGSQLPGHRQLVTVIAHHRPACSNRPQPEMSTRSGELHKVGAPCCSGPQPRAR